MTNKILDIFVYFVLLFLFLSSCDNNVDISDQKEIEGGVWNISETVEVNAQIPNTKISYNLYISVIVKEDFLTNNLWLFVQTKSPSGNIQNDTLQFYVTDVKGRWFGNKNGQIIKNKFLYKSNISFPEKGTYYFSLKHGMRKKDLPKIETIGITLEEINSN